LRDVGDWSPTRQKIWLSFSFVQRRRRRRSTPETASTGQIHDKSPRASESSGEPSVQSRRKAAMRTWTGKIRISTSFAERQNWTVRTTMRCYTPCRMTFRANWRITRLHPQAFCLQFHQVSSYTSHVSGHGRWRYGSALERKRTWLPSGNLTSSGGRKERRR